MSFTREPIGTRHPQIDPLQALSYMDRLQTDDLYRQHLQQSIYGESVAQTDRRRALAHTALTKDIATALGTTPEEAGRLVPQLPQYQDLLSQYEQAFQPRTETVPSGIFGWGRKNVMVPPSGVTQGLRERTAEGTRGVVPSLYQSKAEEALVAGGGRPLEETPTGRAFQAAQAGRQSRGEAPLPPKELVEGLAEGRRALEDRIREAQEPALKLEAQARLDLHNAQKTQAELESKVSKYKLGEATLPPTSPLAQENKLRLAEHQAIIDDHKLNMKEKQWQWDRAKESLEAARRGDLRGALLAAGASGIETLVRIDETKALHLRQSLDDLTKARLELVAETRDPDKAVALAMKTNQLSLDIAKTSNAERMSLDVAKIVPGTLYGTNLTKFVAPNVPIKVGEAYITGNLNPLPTDSPEVAGRKGAWLTYIGSADVFKHAPMGSLSIDALREMVRSIGLSPQAEEEAIKNLLSEPLVQRKVQIAPKSGVRPFPVRR